MKLISILLVLFSFQVVLVVGRRVETNPQFWAIFTPFSSLKVPTEDDWDWAKYYAARALTEQRGAFETATTRIEAIFNDMEGYVTKAWDELSEYFYTNFPRGTDFSTLKKIEKYFTDLKTKIKTNYKSRAINIANSGGELAIRKTNMENIWVEIDADIAFKDPLKEDLLSMRSEEDFEEGIAQGDGDKVDSIVDEMASSLQQEKEYALSVLETFPPIEYNDEKAFEQLFDIFYEELQVIAGRSPPIFLEIDNLLYAFDQLRMDLRIVLRKLNSELETAIGKEEAKFYAKLISNSYESVFKQLSKFKSATSSAMKELERTMDPDDSYPLRRSFYRALSAVEIEILQEAAGFLSDFKPKEKRPDVKVVQKKMINRASEAAESFEEELLDTVKKLVNLRKQLIQLYEEVIEGVTNFKANAVAHLRSKVGYSKLHENILAEGLDLLFVKTSSE